MTKLLIKRFIKDYENTQNSDVRTAYGKFSSIVGIVCNAILFISKLIVGTLSASVSITADAVNNLSDASSSIISLLGFKLASRPADEEHPYGHGRYEYLSGLMVAVLIMVIGVELFKSSLDKVLHPSAVEFSWVTVGVLAFSILLKTWMALFNTKTGKMINSNTLIATAADSRNDVITTGAVLVAAILSHFVGFELDGWMGLGVAVFILYSGFGLVKDTLDPMLGKAPEDEQVEEIRQKILSYPGVLGTHDLMVHDYGPGRIIASAHAEVPSNIDVMKLHDVIDNVESKINKELGIIMCIHMDPIVVDDKEVDRYKALAKEVITDYDSEFTFHDFRVVKGETHTNLIFDLIIPFCDDDKKAQISADLIKKFKEKDSSLEIVMVIEHSFI